MTRLQLLDARVKLIHGKNTERITSARYLVETGTAIYQRGKEFVLIDSPFGLTELNKIELAAVIIAKRTCQIPKLVMS